MFAVLAFNKDLLGEHAEAKLGPCRRVVANKLAAGDRPPASDPEGLEAISMVYARPVFASIGLSVGREALDLIVSMAQPVRRGHYFYRHSIFFSSSVSSRGITMNLMPFAWQAYYEDPEGFIARRFYAGNISSALVGSHHLAHTYGTPQQWTEQDGVINRLLIEQEAVSLVPRCPRAFHAGFVGEIYPRCIVGRSAECFLHR